MQSRLVKIMLIGVCLVMFIGVSSPQPSIGQSVSVEVTKIDQAAKIIGLASVSKDTNEVVYVCQGKDKAYYTDVWVYDVNTKQSTQITSGGISVTYPMMNSKYIVWSENKYDDKGRKISRRSDIALYFRETKEKKIISSNPYEEGQPVLSGNFLVWWEHWSWLDYNKIGWWGYDILKDKTYEIKPFDVPSVYGRSIDGSRFVWSDNTSGNFDIYMFDLETGTKKTICNAAKDQIFPSIDRDHVVWEDERNQSKSPSDNSDIYGYKFSDDSEFIVDDDIDKTAECPSVKNGKIAYISTNAGTTNALVVDLNNGKQQIHKSDALKGGLFNMPLLSDEYVVYVDTNTSKVSGYSFAGGERFDIALVEHPIFWLNISRNILAWTIIPKDETIPREIYVAKKTNNFNGRKKL